MWNSFALALQVMTSLPLLNEQSPSREEARRAVFLFPLVGALVGIVLAAVWTLGSRVWSGQPLVAAALTLTAGVWLTGGRGLGGAARAADGLAAHGAGGDRARAFAVMRDPRRGTSGGVAAGAFLALRLAFLAALPSTHAWTSLVIAGAVGGWAVAFAYSAFPMAAAGEASTGLTDAGPGEFAASTAVAILCSAALLPRGPLSLLAAGLVVGPAAQAVRRTLGGLSPSLCAALGEAAELAALACLSL